MKATGALALVVALAASAGQARAESYAIDAQGRSLRVAFDPGSQIRMGALSGVTGAGSRVQVANSVEAGIAWRSVARSGKHGDEVRWQLDHRLVWGQLMPAAESAGGLLRPLDASLYAGTWLRHADASYLMLPTSPPRNVFFPLDIGVDMEFGRLRVPPAPADSPQPALLRIGAARAAVLLDPLRSSRTGNSLEFGIGPRYDLDLVGSPGLQRAATIHRISPFTATSLRWRCQDARGLMVVELAGTWYPHWASDGYWTSRAAELRGRLHRVVVAVNDEPIAVVVDSSYAVNPPIRDGIGSDEFRLQAGLSMGVQLR